jgi:hypothetical protein
MLRSLLFVSCVYYSKGKVKSQEEKGKSGGTVLDHLQCVLLGSSEPYVGSVSPHFMRLLYQRESQKSRGKSGNYPQHHSPASLRQ